MLEKIDLSKKMKKKEYQKQSEVLSEQLSELQRECKAIGIPVVIVFEGVGGSGKGTLINRLIQSLDPRGFHVYAINGASEEEYMRPFLWRFWTKIPEKGRVALFDRSWYRRVLHERFENRITQNQVVSAFSEIRSFEKQLTDDGTVMLKFFLHISRQEQKRRFEKLLSNKETAWRVGSHDLQINKHYERYMRMNEEMLEKTDTDYAPWHIIEANDRDFASVKILALTVECLKERLEEERKKQQAASAKEEEQAPEQEIEIELEMNMDIETDAEQIEETEKPEVLQEEETQADLVPENKAEAAMFQSTMLSKVDLSLSMEKDDYKKKLAKLQERLSILHSELYRRRIPVILAFEGWDAGGKGGAIKRLTQAMDPRGYRVNPTASPNDTERAHHYLWRFWDTVPKAGHIAIYDRTWYGRVMVERVEGFCSEAEWKRAYQEINDMEEHLANFGTVILKFWMHIDKDEQERRFLERQQNSAKQWKITEEDWRNREKWDLYEAAVDEMLIRTSTTYAPWIIVEGNSKYYARIKVLSQVVETLEQRLKEADAAGEKAKKEAKQKSSRNQ